MSMLAEIRCPLVLAVPNQNHRSTDAQNQLIHCSLVGSHKFKPKSQYNVTVILVVRDKCKINTTSTNTVPRTVLGNVQSH